MSISVEYLVVAGGGGGGAGGGGGGGGGVLAGSAALAAGTNYTVTVGIHGTGGATNAPNGATKGDNSVFNNQTAIGGGPGGGTPNSGGSGGGGGYGYNLTGGAGTAGQGFAGGNGIASGSYGGGGGGGAGGVGQNAPSQGGTGGLGFLSSISGAAVKYGGGGGGGSTLTPNGTDGGGNGGTGDGQNTQTQGAANRGGGGGGGGNGSTYAVGRNGGSGVVILKYPENVTISASGGSLTFTTVTVGQFNVTTFTVGTGSVQFSQPIILVPGLYAPATVIRGNSFDVTLVTENIADNTAIAYAITGATSADLSGNPLTGNFTVVGNQATVVIQTAAVPLNRTLTISANGHTATVALLVQGAVSAKCLIVAGGGSGGNSNTTNANGGGGAGGVLYSDAIEFIGNTAITVGAGGAAVANSTVGLGNKGTNSSVPNITAPGFTLAYETMTYVATSNVTLTNNGTQDVTMFKTADNNSWNGEVRSTTVFFAPCTIEFSKQAAAGDNAASYAMIGWNQDPTTDTSYGSLDYCAYPYTFNTYVVYHNGAQVHAAGAWDVNQRFRVVYDTDGFIRHYNGSTLLYSVFYGSNIPVYVDSSFYSVNSTTGGFSNVKVTRASWNGTTYTGPDLNYVAQGGGGGGTTAAAAGAVMNGGSGGGAANSQPFASVSTQSSVGNAIGYGNPGGSSGVSWTGAGGGGAGAIGINGAGSTPGGNGGAGRSFDISGSEKFYAGGGGGGGNSSERAGDGFHGGGRGAGTTTYYAHNSYPVGINSTTLGSSTPNAIANTGGGGGGGSYWAPNGGWMTGSGAGGSGIVVIRYPGAAKGTGGAITTVGGDTVHTFTVSETFSLTPGQTVYDAGLNVNTSSIFNGFPIEIVYVDQTLADNATVAYTITGVTSSDINGAALTGNFIMSAGIAYLTLTASIVVANKTLTITAGSTSFDVIVTRPPVAAGGVVTTVADNGEIYRAHTFTASGTLTIYTPVVFDYLMVAGGGGGGTDMGGGGGAGGYIHAQQVSLAAGTYDIVVGGGGNGAPQTALNASPSGSNGTNTTFNGLTAIGGGGGASNHSNTISNAGNGGSGGGGSGGRMSSASYGGLAGTGTAGQGFNGAGSGVTWYPGGGGGAGAAASQTGSQQANGGVGRSNKMLGTVLFWAGGGAGAGYSIFGGNGGLGGGGGGAPRESASTANGTGGGSALNPGSNAVIGTLGAQTNVAGGAAGANTGSGGGGGSHYQGANQGGNGGSGIFIIRYPGPGMAASSNDMTAGETLTINLRTEDLVDNTTIAYAITGVDSGDINGSALSGNFTMINNTASVSFLITTAAKKTLTFESNGFTETVALIENRYGLAFLPGDSNQSLTSLSYPQLVDISDRYDLTDITILSSTEQFKFSTQPVESVTSYTASDAANIIDLSTSTAGLLNITILQTNDLYKYAVQLGDSVLVDDKVLYSPDLVSIVLFNVPEPIPLTFPERWAG